MKKFRNLVAAILALVMVLSLAGCGSSSNKETADATTKTPAEKTTETVEEVPVNMEPADVVVWHSFSGPTGEAFESIVNDYNNGRGKDQNIHITSVFQGYEGTGKVVLAYQTKDYDNAPDINVGLTSTIPSVMEMGWTVSLDDFINNPSSEISKDTFYPALVRAVTYEGKMDGIPFGNSIPLLYYNVNMLKEAGFDRAPETMDELIEYVDALKIVDGNDVTRYGLNMQVKRYQMVEFVVSQSEDSFFGNNEGGRTAPMTKIIAGEDGTMKAFLEKIDGLLATGGYKYIEDNIKEEFAQGLHAMTIMSSSKLGAMDALMADQYMTAYLPKVNSGDTSGAGVGGSCLNLFDRGDERRLEAAYDFMEYLVSPENQYTFATASGYLPVNVETENLAEMVKYYEEHPQYKVALDQLKDTSLYAQEPLDLTYGANNSIITDTMLEFCQGDLSVDEAVNQMVTQINDALDEYHDAN